MARTVLLTILGVLLLAPAAFATDPVGRAGGLLTRAHDVSWRAKQSENTALFRQALALYERARDLLNSADARSKTADAAKRSEHLESALAGIAMCETYLKEVDPEGGVPEEEAAPRAPVKPLPARKKGPRVKPWIRAAIAQYHATKDPHARAAYAHGILAEAGIHAVADVCKLFESEQAPIAREGLHAALADFGTARVATHMKSYAKHEHEALQRHALDVIYRCLRKNEKSEKERPFLRAVRAFQALKNVELSGEIIETLDKMGREGVAALGEVIYVPDFGHHAKVVALLSTKRDGRAVPPLVFKMNRFKFDQDVQVPAHEALLKMGWYAVPALIDRLDDKATGIWISWTLRKITGETMGTDKRKWHDWWKTEVHKHPELKDPSKPAVEGPITGPVDK